MPDSTLSLCLIARNAEHTLGQALESVRPFVDEIVVVDTGSTDHTKQIAAASAAKVFDLPWPDSFSAARNHSLDQATGDWIFWMDADDVLQPGGGQELRRLIENCPAQDAAFLVSVEEVRQSATGKRPTITSHRHVKLFPRRDDIRFRYRVHEQIAPAISRLGLPIRPSQAVLRHVTDRSEAAQAARRERNLRLALLDLAEHPGDPFVLFSLGITYLYRPGGLPAATKYLEQSVAACPRGAEIQLNGFLYWGQALSLAPQPLDEEQVYREALAIFPDDASLLHRLAVYYEKWGRLEEAARQLQRLLTHGRGHTSTIQVQTTPEQLALRLGGLYIRLGRRHQAERLWHAFLQEHPRAQVVRQALARSYLNPCSFVAGQAPGA